MDDSDGAPQSDWGRDLPSLPFKIHKTINLTSAGPLGFPETQPNSNLDFASYSTTATTVRTLNVSAQPADVSI